MEKKKRALVFTAVTALILTLGVAQVGAQVCPPVVERDMYPGESIEVEKTVTTPALLPVVDVVISMDLTGSMGGELDNLKLEVDDIINALSAEAADLHVGVVSHEDYEGDFDSCGYSATYGAPGDEPFRVDHMLDDDFAAASAAVTAMSLGNGEDGPESYARVMWESGHADNLMGFRGNAQKIMVMFLDNVPHDCDLYDDGTVSTGVDPGRDATAGTGDDIDLQDDAITAMQATGVTLLVVNSGGDMALWNSIAGATGGSAVQINDDGTVPGGISLTDLILQLVAEVTTDVWWEVGACPDLDITLSPAVHYDVPGNSVVPFTETIAVPNDTPPGDYECIVLFYANSYPDEGTVIGEEVVRIHVRPIPVDVDINPCIYPNYVRLCGTCGGLNNSYVLVGIESNSPPFFIDAADIDLTTVRFGPGQAAPFSWSLEDLCCPGDGDDDLLLVFWGDETGLQPGYTEVTLTGNLYDGRAIEGKDSVRVLPCRPCWRFR